MHTSELLKASELLPFPTGEILTTRTGTQYELEFNNLIDKWVRTEENTVENITTLTKIIKYVNRLGFIPTSLKIDTLTSIINKHNTYFKGKPSKDALINFISTKMFDISANPINLIQGQSGVDEATGVIKEKAVQQPMHIKSKSFSPGSPQSKMSLLILTLSGKENTGIVASAMKNFEACSQYYYQTLSNGTAEEQERLLMNIEILGKLMNLLANAYAKDHSKLPSDIREALLKVNNVDDAFLLFSALLSLSTDNAKDPTLAKINAGPQMMSLYNAGLMIGLDLNTLIEVMTSLVGWQINSLMKSNVFNDTSGIFNIDGIFDYIKNGPKLEFNRLNSGIKQRIKLAVLIYLRNSTNKYKDLTIDKLNDNLVYRTLLSPRFNLSKALSSDTYTGETDIHNKAIEIAKKYLEDFQKSKEYYVEKSKNQKADLDLEPKKKSLQKAYLKTIKTISELDSKIQAVSDFINDTEFSDSEIRNNLETIITNQASAMIDMANTELSDNFSYEDKSALKFSRFRKALAKYKSFNRLCARETIISPFNNEEYSAIDTIKMLSHIANELSRLRPILALNQSLPNDVASQFKFLRNFEGIFKARLQESPNKEFAERFKEWNDGSLEISFNKFMTDSLYRESIIEFYDEIKAAVNIFDIMDKSKHYFGYGEALNALVESCRYGSIVYRESDKISKDILNKYFNVSRNGTLHKKYLKFIMNFLTSKINNLFLLSKNVVVNIPPGKVILANGSETISNTNTEILLGTPAGNANFKHWMESVVIPAFKNGYNGGVPLSAYYDLIEDLTLISTNNTFDKKASVVYALTENMMPKSDSERAVFKHYKDELNLLLKYEYANIPVLDLLFYYNLIVNNGLSGLNTLTTLFEDIFAEKTNDTVNDYIKFYSIFDKEGKLELNNDYTEDELLQYIAPLENLEQGKLKYIRAYNPNTMNIVLLKQKELESQELNEDLDYQEYNDIIEELDFMEEEISTTVDFSDRLSNSNYELFAQHEGKSKYFTNNYYDESSRVSLSGDISMDNGIITIKKKEYTANMLVSLANANGHGIHSIDLIVIKKTIRTPDGPKLIIDSDITLSRILQILEENC